MKTFLIDSRRRLVVRKSAGLRLIYMAVGVLLLWPAGAQAERLISSRNPDGLTFSTGNVYFTSHDAAGAAVWRTSQTSVPGQEQVLYWEDGARFGDITFAQVNGGFFGYFFAEKSNVITIRRVSLAGGRMQILATVKNLEIAKTHRNLVTDGVNLYWQDLLSVRKIPIGGGPQTVLDQTRLQLPVTAQPASAGIALRGDTVIYAFGRDIRFVPKAGTTVTPAVRTIVSASARVTALHAVSNGIYWGEETGAIRLKAGATITTLSSTANFRPTSIWSNTAANTAGARVAWTQCEEQACRLHDTGAFGTITVGAEAMAIFLTPFPGKSFWGDAAGVHQR